jgi:hypothetical protein
MEDYTSLEPLAEIYLEDSWILAIEARPGSLTFKIDMVLTERHPLYHPRLPGEQYSYWVGTLEFSGVTELTWTNQDAQPSLDANGTLDYGNIDVMTFEGDRYQLEGSWGEMVVVAKAVTVTYDEEPAGRPSES